MEPKIYTYQKKYVTSEGIVKYCEYQNTYIPKDKSVKQVRKKREGSVYEITKKSKELDVEDRELVKAYIRELQERKQRINKNIQQAV